MKALMFAIAACATVASFDRAAAATKAQRCESYARNATASTPTTTGVVRGAARGAIGGAIGGNAGGGAAAGAVIGGTRRVVQKGRSYNSYYDSCMRRK